MPDGDRYAALEFFKSAALWHPHMAATLTEAKLLIRNLRSTLKEFNDDALINGLIEEVEGFLDDARKTVPDNKVDVLKFHFVHRQERPFFWQAAKLLVVGALPAQQRCSREGLLPADDPLRKVVPEVECDRGPNPTLYDVDDK